MSTSPASVTSNPRLASRSTSPAMRNAVGPMLTPRRPAPRSIGKPMISTPRSRFARPDAFDSPRVLMLDSSRRRDRIRPGLRVEVEVSHHRFGGMADRTEAVASPLGAPPVREHLPPVSPSAPGLREERLEYRVIRARLHRLV